VTVQLSSQYSGIINLKHERAKDENENDLLHFSSSHNANRNGMMDFNRGASGTGIEA
jgi:hypothetical protein